MMQEDSLKKRYSFKLSTNLFGLGSGLLIQAIIPSGLGPKAYGDFSFLTSFFQQIFSFFDTGTSMCFYTKLSQRQKESSLASFYLYFSCIISLSVIGFLVITRLSSIYEHIWPDQKMFYIYLAACWGILTWFLQVLYKMTDAYGLTVAAEMARMAQKAFGLVFIVFLFLCHQLNLRNLFFYNYFIFGILAVALIWIMEHKGYSLIKSWRLSRAQFKGYINEFYCYSRPLIIAALLALIVGILDRWLLQVFGAKLEQGYYGLSYMIGTASFLFVGSMTPLIIREFSIAYAKKDTNRMAYLFRRYIPFLYSISAFFSCFIAIQADKVIYIIGGKQYSGAFWAVTILALYPIHQTYGQLSGSVFMATGQTNLYSKIVSTFNLIGIPLSYLLIAPENKMGLNAGAFGLALKMVIMQVIAVNVQLYYNCKYLKLRFWRYVGHQIIIMGFLLGVSTVIMIGVDKLFDIHDKVIINFILSGIIYSFIVMAFVYFQPILFGLRRKDINYFMKYILRKRI